MSISSALPPGINSCLAYNLSTENTASLSTKEKQLAPRCSSLSDLAPIKEQSLAQRLLSVLFKARFSDSPSRAKLHASVNADGQAVVTTEDGYSIKFTGKDQAWTISSPENKTTRIWGDPHVLESDTDTWDFTETSTFLFGNNKATVETIPTTNGASLSQTVTIYQGDDRFTITNLDKDKPELVRWTFDAQTHDAELNDGTVYQLSSESNGRESWKKLE